MRDFLSSRWYVLPALSGALVILTFHPFNLWPLGYIALAPLFWFAGGFNHPRRRVFYGGLICGGMFAFFLSYYTIAQFHWLPQTYLFVWAVRGLVVPITLIGGGLCGASMVIYSTLRGRSPLLNAALAAATYTLSELVFWYFFFGYNVGLLAYAATPINPLLSLAALGGAHFLSFVIALVSGFAAEALITMRVPWRALAAAAAAFAVIGVPNYIYLHHPAEVQKSISLAVLQEGESSRVPFGTEHNGRFFWGEGAALADAASTTPDLLIYPFSSVNGALYGEGVSTTTFNKKVLVASVSSLGEFAAGIMPASTTLMTWDDMYEGGRFYERYEFWQGGALTSLYTKRELFPFINYTPAWAQRFGFYSTSYDLSPGAPMNGLSLNGTPVGDLMCSEVHDTSLARQEARRAPLIIAVGSDAIFVDDVVGAFSLKEAQLRAAENDVPVVRGNILGPSAITDRFGGLAAYAPAGEETVIGAEVPLIAPRPTLYNHLGDLPLLLLMAAILGCAWRTRVKAQE